jgi:glycosyltransferase involved in cell wall biosynthesis
LTFDNPPLVSIGVPTYNRAARLRLTLASILQQSYRELEIVVSDNASTDDTWDVCLGAAAQSSRVRIFRKAANIGPVANFEFVRNQASGKYFMWLADDDSISENYVSACVERLERDADVVLVHGPASYVRADGTGYDEAVFALDQRAAIHRVMAYFCRVSQNGMFYGVYRRAAIVGCRMPNILGGDWAWIADVALQGKTALEPGVGIRRSAAGTSASSARIMELVAAPRWMRRHPSLGLAVGVGGFIALKSASFAASYPFTRFAVAPLVTAILWLRLILKPTLRRCLSPVLPHRSAKNGAAGK